MEFCKDRVFTSLNADELKQGDKVIVANTMANLREDVRKGINIDMLREVHGEDCLSRFIVKEGWFPLAYLVERKENCTNCSHSCKSINPCLRYKPKTEQKAEKHYRPFKDTDELIKVWREKSKQVHSDYSLTMPYIWVQEKETGARKLITSFLDIAIGMGLEGNSMKDLFTDYTFLDGSPCGVEE